MPVPMSKKEIEITIQQLKDRNNAAHPAHYDRVIERLCNYVVANIDDFMECYEDDMMPHYADEVERLCNYVEANIDDHIRKASGDYDKS